MTLDTVFIRDSAPEFVDSPSGLVLLSVASGAYFSLNATGSQIWNMLVEPRRVKEIFAALAETCDGDRDTMIKDVVNFLGTLLERRLVKVVYPDASA